MTTLSTDAPKSALSRLLMAVTHQKLLAFASLIVLLIGFSIASPNFMSRAFSSALKWMCFIGTRFRSISLSALRNSTCLAICSCVDLARRNSKGWKTRLIAV